MQITKAYPIACTKKARDNIDKDTLYVWYVAVSWRGEANEYKTVQFS